MFADGLLDVRRIWWLLPSCTSWFPLYCCVSCWASSHCHVCGSSVPSCFVACVPPNFGLFLLLLLARSPLLVCGAGGAACRSLPPIVAVRLSHFQLGGTRGTGHFCTCLQIYKLTSD